MVTRPAVVREAATVRSASAIDDCARAFLGRFVGERPEQAEHAVPTTGGRPDDRASARTAEGDHAEPIGAAGDEAADDEGGALGHVRLAPVGGAEVHRRGAVDEQPGRQLAVGHVLADLRDAAARGGLPVDAPDVVARLVRPDAVELQAGAKAQPAVVADEASPRASGQGDLQPADEVLGDRARTGSCGAALPPGEPGEVAAARRVEGHAVAAPWLARSSCGAGTRLRTRWMTLSGVMPSVRAA